ncbi:MAG: histidine ammonia-lyase, partial [Pseudomonadota bacterium]
IEMLCGMEGIRFRAPLATSAPLQSAMQEVSRTIDPLDTDRFLAPDLEAAGAIVRSGALLSSTGIPFPDLETHAT